MKDMSNGDKDVASRSVLDDVKMAAMMGDAPLCDVCGAITRRNGACYVCDSCGRSMGCS